MGRHLSSAVTQHHAAAAPWDGSGTAPALLRDILRAKTVITNLKLGYKPDTLPMTDDDMWATFMSDRRSLTWPGTSPPAPATRPRPAATRVQRVDHAGRRARPVFHRPGRPVGRVRVRPASDGPAAD